MYNSLFPPRSPERSCFADPNTRRNRQSALQRIPSAAIIRDWGMTKAVNHSLAGLGEFLPAPLIFWAVYQANNFDQRNLFNVLLVPIACRDSATCRAPMQGNNGPTHMRRETHFSITATETRIRQTQMAARPTQMGIRPMHMAVRPMPMAALPTHMARRKSNTMT